ANELLRRRKHSQVSKGRPLPTRTTDKRDHRDQLRGSLPAEGGAILEGFPFRKENCRPQQDRGNSYHRGRWGTSGYRQSGRWRNTRRVCSSKVAKRRSRKGAHESARKRGPRNRRDGNWT